MIKELIDTLTVVDVKQILEESEIQVEVVSEPYPVGERHTATDVEMTFDIFKFRAALVRRLTR
jgi:hypothetical protein